MTLLWWKETLTETPYPVLQTASTRLQVKALEALTECRFEAASTRLRAKALEIPAECQLRALERSCTIVRFTCVHAENDRLQALLCGRVGVSLGCCPHASFWLRFARLANNLNLKYKAYVLHGVEKCVVRGLAMEMRLL